MRGFVLSTDLCGWLREEDLRLEETHPSGCLEPPPDGEAARDQKIPALAVLSGMFTYAEQRDRVSKNPVRRVKKPSGRRKRAVVCLPQVTVELARARLLEDKRYSDAALVSLLAYARQGPGSARLGMAPRSGPHGALGTEERRWQDRRRPEDGPTAAYNATVGNLPTRASPQTGSEKDRGSSGQPES